jgi:cytidyltransferase-like protein
MPTNKVVNPAPVMFIGRWQPPHQGHMALVRTALDEGKDVVIALRARYDDDTDPFSDDERIAMWRALFDSEGVADDRYQFVVIPDISEVRYGRDVGYAVNQVTLDADTESISGTKIREAMRS